MSTKYYGRAGSVISRDNSAVDRGDRQSSWFDDYVDNLEKSAVKSKKEDHSMFDQINNILGNKSKYSSVEEAVLDMQRRTGLSDYLNSKKASDDGNLEIFRKVPALKIFIDNYVEARPGTSVEAVIHDLLKIKSIRENLPDNDDVTDDVKHYINKKISDSSLNNPQSDSEDLELGKLDLTTDDNLSSDNDPFGGCEPVKE